MYKVREVVEGAASVASDRYLPLTFATRSAAIELIETLQGYFLSSGHEKDQGAWWARDGVARVYHWTVEGGPDISDA